MSRGAWVLYADTNKEAIPIAPGSSRAPYPAHREADIVLRDGTTVHVRPLQPDDEAAVMAFYRGLSEEARTLRFFTRTTNEALAERARKLVDVDYARR